MKVSDFLVLQEMTWNVLKLKNISNSVSAKPKQIIVCDYDCLLCFVCQSVCLSAYLFVSITLSMSDTLFVLFVFCL